MNTPDTHTTEGSRPFGYWITAIDRLLKAEFATVFEDEGITRRDWRMLNRIDGTVASDRPVRGEKLHRLAELGWVERISGGWALTDAGRLAKTRLADAVQQIRDRVAGAVAPEEFATMAASLEKIAREFGWREGRKLPRSRPHGHGHGHRHEHERRHEHEHEHEHEHAYEHGHRAHRDHVPHGNHRGRCGERRAHRATHAGNDARTHGHGFRSHGFRTPHIHIHTRG